MIKTTFLLLPSLLFFCCRQFPEGGTRLNARMIFKSTSQTCWDIVRYEVDGVDSTFFVAESGNKENLKGAFCMHQSKYSNYYSLGGRNARSFSVQDSRFTELRFNADSSMVRTDNDRLRNVVCPEGATFTWKIKRCKLSEIILQGQTDKLYRLVLEKQ